MQSTINRAFAFGFGFLAGWEHQMIILYISIAFYIIMGVLFPYLMRSWKIGGSILHK